MTWYGDFICHKKKVARVGPSMDGFTPLVLLSSRALGVEDEVDLKVKQLEVGMLFMDWKDNWLKLWWAMYRTWERLSPSLSHLELQMRVAEGLFDAGFRARKDIKWSSKTIYIEYDPFLDVVDFKLVSDYILDKIQRWFRGEEYVLDPREGTKDDPRVRKGLISAYNIRGQETQAVNKEAIRRAFVEELDEGKNNQKPAACSSECGKKQEDDNKDEEEDEKHRNYVEVLDSEDEFYYDAMVLKAGEGEIGKTW